MFSIDSALAAEIDYRWERVRSHWVPRRRGIRAVARPRRRLHAGPRPGTVGPATA